jgi:hypothetical protein
MKFRRGLDRDIQDKIAESGVGCPSNSDPTSWYDAAKRLDQNRIANEVFNSSVHPMATPDLSSPATPMTPAAIQLPLTKHPDPFNVQRMPVDERHALLEELLVLRRLFQSKRKPVKATQTMRQTLSTPLLHSRNCYDVLPVDVIEETSVSSHESELNVLDTPLAPAMSPSDVRNVKLPSWERRLPRKYIVTSTPGGNSLSIDVDIQCTESGIRRTTQSLVDCGATGVFMDEQWVKDNGIVTRQLSRPIPVYNVDGSPNEAGPISEVATVILRYNGHSERTSFAVTQCQSVVGDDLWRTANLNPGGPLDRCQALSSSW